MTYEEFTAFMGGCLYQDLLMVSRGVRDMGTLNLCADEECIDKVLFVIKTFDNNLPSNVIIEKYIDISSPTDLFSIIYYNKNGKDKAKRILEIWNDLNKEIDHAETGRLFSYSEEAIEEFIKGIKQ